MTKRNFKDNLFYLASSLDPNPKQVKNVHVNLSDLDGSFKNCHVDLYDGQRIILDCYSVRQQNNDIKIKLYNQVLYYDNDKPLNVIYDFDSHSVYLAS